MKIIFYLLSLLFVSMQLLGVENLSELFIHSKSNPYWFDEHSERVKVINFYEANEGNFPPELYPDVVLAYFLDEIPETRKENAEKIWRLVLKTYQSERGFMNFVRAGGFLSTCDLGYYKEAFNMSLNQYFAKGIRSILGLKMAYSVVAKGKLESDKEFAYHILAASAPAAAFAREDKDMNLFYLNVINESSDPELPKVLLLVLGVDVDNDDVSLNAAKYLLIKKYLGEVSAVEFYAAVEDKFKGDSARLEAFKAACAKGKVKLDFDAAFERLKTLLITLMKMGVM